MQIERREQDRGYRTGALSRAALSGGAVALGDMYDRAAGVRAVAFLEAAGEALEASTIRFC
jgi:hypothetical protein